MVEATRCRAPPSLSDDGRRELAIWQPPNVAVYGPSVGRWLHAQRVYGHGVCGVSLATLQRRAGQHQPADGPWLSSPEPNRLQPTCCCMRGCHLAVLLPTAEGRTAARVRGLAQGSPKQIVMLQCVIRAINKTWISIRSVLLTGSYGTVA